MKYTFEGVSILERGHVDVSHPGNVKHNCFHALHLRSRPRSISLAVGKQTGAIARVLIRGAAYG